MFYILDGRKLLDAVLCLCLVLSGVLLVRTAQGLRTADCLFSPQPCLIIDPGHGGIDGGAVAFNGVRESDINLSIALKLRELAGFFGVSTALTRTDDSSRSDGASYSEHEDLVRRTELINGVPNGVLISIHQNFFPTSQPSGAQVLYAKGERSRALGVCTHGNLVSALQPKNRRLAEPAPERLYITSHVNCPAILVECGFLSNLSDLDQLARDPYQTSLAAVLLASYLQFIGSESSV